MLASEQRARRQTVALIRRLCVVPERLTVTEWADRYRQLPETSTSPGKYSCATTPYLRRPQDVMGDPAIPMVVLCFGAQLGKSTAIENAIGYRIHRTPSPMVVVQPKIEAAENWAKQRFVPMVRSTPVLRDLVRLNRSSDSTMRYKTFPGGFIFVAGAQSATELASYSTPTVALDEVDRMEVIPGEGNPVEIALRRQGAADIGTAILTSTPRDAETTIIYPYLEAGTYERYLVICPECKHPQPFVWERLELDTACYICESCGVLIEERWKRWMMDPANGADWQATNPDGRYPSFHLNSLYSPFGKSGWEAMRAAWLRAQGKPADLQVFINTWLAELWTETGDQLKADELTARLEGGFVEGEVPSGVGALTIGVDVQGDRIEWWVWGWGAGLESWPIDAGVISGDPERESWDSLNPWVQLEREVLDREWPCASGPPLRLEAGFVDSGYATTKVYNVVKRWKKRRIFASKGNGGRGLPLTGKPTYLRHHGITLYSIGTDGAKTEFLRSQLYERAHGPGFVHLPDWLETAQLQQFVAEKRKRRVHRGAVIYEWVKVSDDARNEGLDCRILARAALDLLGQKFVRKLGEYAALRTGSAMPISAAPSAPPKSYVAQRTEARAARARGPHAGGWVNKWRK